MQQIELDKGFANIHHVCVNSKYKARFLAKENEKYCQCTFGECKVKVDIKYNGHDYYTYILTEEEVKSLPILI